MDMLLHILIVFIIILFTAAVFMLVMLVGSISNFFPNIKVCHVLVVRLLS